MKKMRNSILMKIATLLLAVCMFAGVIPETAFAASTETISVSGTNNYSMANSVLTEVNKQRSKAGASKLTMDKTLTDEAMKRAAEISIYYSHTRPNGSKYTTAYSKGGSTAENIAAGYSSASAVMNGWMNSSGHKKNILNKSYKSIGIGSFTNNGTTYWVQIFSSKSGTSASKSGSASKTVSVSVKSSNVSGNLSLKPASTSINKGKSTSITAYLKNKGDTRFKAKINTNSLKWSSGSTSVATVNSSGKVTGKAAGSAKIKAKTSAGGASATTTITVKGSSSSSGKSTSNSSSSSTTKLSSCTISLSKTSYTYDGSAKKPGVTVKKGSTTLKSGTDYSTSYKSNTNAGTASVVVTGKGKYSGSVTKTFKINAANISGCTISLSKTSYTYDGTAKKPTVTVKKGSTTLKSGTDYSVSYKNNTSAGTASAVVTGKGNYTGSGTKTFTINKASTSSSSSSSSSTSESAPSAPKITSLKSSSAGELTVNWNKVSGVDGYYLTYSQNSNFYSSSSYDTKAFASIASDSVSRTFSDLTKGKTYYVRMQSYKTTNGKKTYSDWSNVMSITITK